MAEVARGFGYTTMWLAVRKQPTKAVADALALARVRRIDWNPGVAAAYADSVFVTPPLGAWTLAVGARLPDFTAGNAALGRLAALSRTLGEVQFFRTQRNAEVHAWARAVNGNVTRAYCFVADQRKITRFVGEPTPDEWALAIGTAAPVGRQDDWWETIPDEDGVLALAGRWSLDPRNIDGGRPPGAGLVGELSARTGLRGLLARLTGRRS
jgi:hypothetical protein